MRNFLGDGSSRGRASSANLIEEMSSRKEHDEDIAARCHRKIQEMTSYCEMDIKTHKRTIQKREAEIEVLKQDIYDVRKQSRSDNSHLGDMEAKYRSDLEADLRASGAEITELRTKLNKTVPNDMVQAYKDSAEANEFGASR